MVFNRRSARVDPSLRDGRKISPDEQIALIFYGDNKEENEKKKKESIEERNTMPQTVTNAVTKVGLQSKLRTGKHAKRDRSHRHSIISSSSGRTSRSDSVQSGRTSRSDSIQSQVSAVPGIGISRVDQSDSKPALHLLEANNGAATTLAVPVESGATNLNPPSRVRGRRLSFDVGSLLKKRRNSFFGRRGSKGKGPEEDSVDVKDESQRRHSVNVAANNGKGIEEEIPLLTLTAEPTDKPGTTEDGRRTSLVEKFQGMDFKTVSEPDLRKMVCRMPTFEEQVDEDDMTLWFSNSTQWMVPLVMAGEIANPPECLENFKNFYIEEEHNKAEEDAEAEDLLAKPASDPRWGMARRWVETVIRPELQQTNFLKKLTFYKNRRESEPQQQCDSAENFIHSRHGKRRRTANAEDLRL